MINLDNARKYCREDISLIENYEQASKDLLETWHLHHRKESEYSMKELKDLGLYHKRPASELVFLTKSQHHSLHNKGKHHSEEARRKMSETRKGIPKSEEHKKKISINHADFSGEKNGRAKQVNQIDTNTGKTIKTWTCAVEASKQLGINNSSISQCCSGKRKSAGGFIWRYADI